MSSKQSPTSDRDKSKRHHRSERARHRDREREGERDGRGRSEQQPEDRQPKRLPSTSPSRPKGQDPPTKPAPKPAPKPQPQPKPASSSSADSFNTPETWSNGQVSARAEWALVEVLSEEVTAILDYNIDNNFVSESFVTRLRRDGRPVEARKASQSKAYYNTLPTKNTIKASIKFPSTGGALKDEILYIVKGDMPDRKPIVLGRKVAAAYERKRTSVVASSQPSYPSSQSHPSKASSAIRSHDQTVYEDTYPSPPSSYNPHDQYTFGVQNPRVDSPGRSEVYYQPASLDDRRGHSPEPEPDQTSDPPWQDYPREHERVDAQQSDYEHEQEYGYSTSATPTEHAYYSDNDSYELSSHEEQSTTSYFEETWQQTPGHLQRDTY